MILEGDHRITYRYDQPVSLGPHFLRMQPRRDPCQQTVRYELDIFPAPDGRETILDAENNEVTTVWFSQMTRSFDVRTRFCVQTLLENPFSFFLAAEPFPPQRGAAQRRLFEPELHTVPSPRVDAVVQQLRLHAKDSFNYALAANQWVSTNIRVSQRATGAPRTADETLASEAGACRDASVLLMALCRSVGIPARYVSGYCHHGGEHTAHELHSWVEVWIPYGGWRGLDPTLGLAVAEHHVALCASAYPENTLPVQGMFGGTAGATIDYEVNLHSADTEDETQTETGKNRKIG